MPDPVVPIQTPPAVVPPVDPDAGKTYTREEFIKVASEKKLIADKAQALEAKITAFEAEKAERERAAMTETDRLKTERDEQKKLAADFKVKADKADAMEKVLREEIKASLGDKWDDDFEVMDFSLLKKVSAKLIATKPDPNKPDKPGDSSKPKVGDMDSKQINDTLNRVRRGEKVALG